MKNREQSPPPLLRRCAGTVLVLLAAAIAGSGVSTADTKDELDAARQRYATLKSRIAAKRDQLANLQGQANQLATQVTSAQARLDQIDAELTDIRADADAAQGRYEALRGRLDQRAREAFMGGTTETMTLLLSSASFAELSDRMEFVNELTGTDSDLALAVNNLSVQLEQDAQRQEELRSEQVKAIESLRAQQERLEAQLEAQQAMLDAIVSDEREAEQLVDDLGDKYRREQAAAAAEAEAAEAAQAAAEPQTPAAAASGGVFQACPVPGGAISDDFGAPRYGGGYHTHEGNDIFAPMGTAIHAPFDGTASSANNTLGGISVIVTGSQGYAYNAHMSGTAKLGAVRAGDVIGYVGDSGDAQGTSPHDHFEWHPGNGDAVDPNPFLLQAC